MSGFSKHRKSGACVATFSAFEADLLRSLAAQLIEQCGIGGSRNDRHCSARRLPDEPPQERQLSRMEGVGDDQYDAQAGQGAVVDGSDGSQGGTLVADPQCHEAFPGSHDDVDQSRSYR